MIASISLDVTELCSVISHSSTVLASQWACCLPAWGLCWKALAILIVSWPTLKGDVSPSTYTSSWLDTGLSSVVNMYAHLSHLRRRQTEACFLCGLELTILVFG